jgi:hypothetical protein
MTQAFNRGNIDFDSGTTNIPTAGTAVALSTDSGLHANYRVVWARFRDAPANSGIVKIGIADVSSTGTLHGWSLENSGQELELPIPDGASIPLGDINFDAATNGDDVEWAILFLKG